MNRKVFHIISAVENSSGMEWLLFGLSREFQVTAVLLNPGNTPLEENLHRRGIECIRIALRSKWSFIPVFIRLLALLLRTRPDVVHVHLLDAQRLGLPAAWLARVKKRIYTRHNSTFHHRYFPSGVVYDRLSNRLATGIISISQATDYALFELEGVSESKVTRIPHGFDFSEFSPASFDRIEMVRHKWNIPLRKPVIGMVSRFIEWKGIAFALTAIEKFRGKFPDAFLVLANARGPQTEILMNRLKAFPNESYVCIPFEEDAAALYGCFDMFVHVPVDQHVEAFGQVYIEALAVGVPSVFTRSGIAAETMEDGKHALFVKHQDPEAIVQALERLWTNPELRRSMSEAGSAYVKANFGMEEMINRMRLLYNA